VDLITPVLLFGKIFRKPSFFDGGETMDFRFSDFSLNQSLDIPSGYVNIAIENDHRHS